MPVVKIHGCNGSGKTTLIRELMSRAEFKVVESTPRGKPLAYAAEVHGHKVVILGSYETACGGLDTINQQEEKMRLLEKYAKPKNTVFMEGILTSGTYGEMGEFSERRGQKWLYVFLDTPFEVCVERVLKRRAEKGNDKPFDPMRSMFNKMRSIAGVKARVEREGRHKVLEIDHRRKPSGQLSAIFNALRDL